MKIIKTLTNNLKNYNNLEKIFFLSFLLYIFLPLLSILFKIVFNVSYEYILLDVIFIIQVLLIIFIVSWLSEKNNKQYKLEQNAAFWLIILVLMWGITSLGIGESDTSTPIFWNITLFPDLFETITFRASLLYAILFSISIIQIIAVFVYKPDINYSRHKVYRNEPHKATFVLGVTNLIIVISSLIINLIIGADVFYIRVHLIFIIFNSIIALLTSIVFRFTASFQSKFTYIKWVGFIFFVSGIIVGYAFLFTSLSFWLFRFTYLLISVMNTITLLYMLVQKNIKKKI